MPQPLGATDRGPPDVYMELGSHVQYVIWPLTSTGFNWNKRQPWTMGAAADDWSRWFLPSAKYMYGNQQRCLVVGRRLARRHFISQSLVETDYCTVLCGGKHQFRTQILLMDLAFALYQLTYTFHVSLQVEGRRQLTEVLGQVLSTLLLKS